MRGVIESFEREQRPTPFQGLLAIACLSTRAVETCCLPQRSRQRHQHAFVAAAHEHRKKEGRDIELRLAVAMCVLHAALEHCQDVVGQHRHSEPQQRRARMAQAADFTLQHRLEPLKHTLDSPALAIELGDLGGADLARQIAPQSDRGLARLGGRVQAQLDAPPGRLALVYGDLLLEELARLDAPACLRLALTEKPWVRGMFAHG